MQSGVYNYILAGSVQKDTVLRKTYNLLALSLTPAAIGALVSDKMGFSLYAMLGDRWMSFIVVMAFFCGMIFLIEKSRYNDAGTTLLMVFTFGMGVLLSPLLQYALNSSNGTRIVGIASVITAAMFSTMSAVAHRTAANMNSPGRFLTADAVVLMIAVVVNFVLQTPALNLAISAGFALFNSLMAMRQVHTVTDGGEDSHISAAFTIFISLYNIFSSLLHLLTALVGDD